MKNKLKALKPSKIFIVFAFLLGLIIRTIQYFGEPSMWKDELFSVINIERMSLAELILQQPAFNGYALQLFAIEGPVTFTLVGLGILLFQLIFSHLWLSKFIYGPMEWLWRSLTYRNWQPIVVSHKEVEIHGSLKPSN